MYDEFAKLKKVLLSDSFKFIIIEYSNYSVINEVKEFLTSTYPQRKQIELSSEIKNYDQFLNKIEELKQGFVLINDFENYLDNENIYCGLNQKRDSFSQLKIALICFVHIASEEQVLKKCNVNIPDLWEFRNLILKIEGEKPIQGNLLFQRSSKEITSLGGTNIESKQEEIVEIEQKLNNLEVAPENYPLILNLYFQIVKIFEGINKYDKAIDYYERTLKIDLSIYGENHPNVARDYNNIGSAWDHLGDSHKAIAFYERALQIDLSILGENHPDVATCYNNLGFAWDNLGNSRKAIAFYERALQIVLPNYGENHPDVAISYNNIGSAWDHLGDYRKAITCYERALKIDLSIYGENHPDVATLYNNIGSAWNHLGDSYKAITYYEHALKIDLSIYGENHPDVATLYNNLGSAWDNLGDSHKSITYYEHALQIFETAFGPDHPNTRTTRANIEDILRENKKRITG